MLAQCLGLGQHEHRAQGGGNRIVAACRHLGGELAGKWTRQHRAMAFMGLAWVSLITRCTPESPRSRRRSRMAVQKVSSSLSPASMPSTSRCPVAVMPTATITALEISYMRA